MKKLFLYFITLLISSVIASAAMAKCPFSYKVYLVDGDGAYEWNALPMLAHAFPDVLQVLDFRVIEGNPQNPNIKFEIYNPSKAACYFQSYLAMLPLPSWRTPTEGVTGPVRGHFAGRLEQPCRSYFRIYEDKNNCSRDTYAQASVFQVTVGTKATPEDYDFLWTWTSKPFDIKELEQKLKEANITSSVGYIRVRNDELKINRLFYVKGNGIYDEINLDQLDQKKLKQLAQLDQEMGVKEKEDVPQVLKPEQVKEILSITGYTPEKPDGTANLRSDRPGRNCIFNVIAGPNQNLEMQGPMTCTDNIQFDIKDKDNPLGLDMKTGGQDYFYFFPHWDPRTWFRYTHYNNFIYYPVFSTPKKNP